MKSHIPGIFKRKSFYISLIALAVTLGVTVGFVHYTNLLSKNIVINDNGHIVEIITMEETVGDLLNKYDILLGPGDEVNPELDQELTRDTEISIIRAMMVNVFADGNKKSVYLTRGTVGDVLKKADVLIREKDEINYNINNRINPGMNIFITRVDDEIVIEKEAVPFKVVTTMNHNMDEGIERVVQQGVQGEIQREILISYRDGKEISRSVVDEWVETEPVDRIVQLGAAKSITNSRGDVIRYSSVQTFTATAYTAGYESTGKAPGHPQYGITASGAKVKPYHTIAASREIPFGTKVYIPEMVEYWRKRGVNISGIFVVQDRGSAITGSKIDIYIEDKAAASRFGRKKVTVYFIK